MLRELAALDFDLGTTETIDFNIGASYPVLVAFTFEDANQVDATIGFFIATSDGEVQIGSNYALDAPSNLTDMYLLQINTVVPILRVKYTRGTNTLGSGSVVIYGDQ